jgi:hypothetical protein
MPRTISVSISNSGTVLAMACVGVQAQHVMYIELLEYFESHAEQYYDKVKSWVIADTPSLANFIKKFLHLRTVRT